MNEVVLGFRKLAFRHYLVFPARMNIRSDGGACDLVLNEDVLVNKNVFPTK